MLKRILHRIRWRTLLSCGIGLWIALCTHDFYYNKFIFPTGKVHSTTAVAHKITIKTDIATMSIPPFIENDPKSWGTVRKSRILTTFIIIFLSIWSILFILYIQEYMRKRSKKIANTKSLDLVKKTSKNTGIQVSSPSSQSTLKIINYEMNEIRSNPKWFSTIKSSLNVSYGFNEEKNEHKVTCKSLEKHREEICKNKKNECKERKIECYIHQCEPTFQLTHYINLSRSIHFQSTLFTRRYTISIFNTFSSLSIIYLFNSLSLRYSSRKSDSTDDNKKIEEVNANKFNIISWPTRRNNKYKVPEFYGKTNGYFISSSPDFQQFLINFMNIRYIQPTYA